MQSPISPKNPVGNIKNTSKGKIMSSSGPAIPLNRSDAKPRTLTTTNKG